MDTTQFDNLAPYLARAIERQNRIDDLAGKVETAQTTYDVKRLYFNGIVTDSEVSDDAKRTAQRAMVRASKALDRAITALDNVRRI